MSYDISNDKRRDKVFKTLRGYGDHAQFSVFFCELSERELAILRGQLREAIHETEDQVLVLDLGPITHPLEAGLEVLGRAYTPLSRTLVV